MKNFLISFLISLGFFVSVDTYAQEIDVSILDDLTQGQIDLAEEFLNDDGIKTRETNLTSEIKEQSIKEKDVDELSTKKNPKFGYNFISSSPTSIVATGDLPLPNDYKISLGDVLGVVLSGSKVEIFDMKVQLDGSVFFPELGAVSVAGESFQDVKTKFKNLIEQSYIGVSIDLSLKDLSAKKITIVGAVNNPGTYLVNPFTTISNSLAYSGGIQDFGSLRNIKLLRSNGKVFKFDLYDLLIDGNRTNDITIESGDVIIVDAAKKFINISGMVRRPATYEIIEDENLSDLLRYAMGFVGGANIQKITLDILDKESLSIVKVITNDTSYSLNNALSVNVFPYLNNVGSNNILISGAIEEPGFYSLEKYKTLEQIINDLKFVDVYPWLAVLEQFDENNLVKSSILFSLNDPDTYRSIHLLPNSKLFFANINSRAFNLESMTMQLIRDYDLRINHKQGSFTLPVFGKYSVKSFVDLLGLDMTDVDSEATYISPLENIVIKDDYESMNYIAKKYNTVSFRSPINDLIRVSIDGAVDYPGEYTLQPDTTLQDLYGLIGEFKDEAFFNGIIFTRSTIRERQIKSINKSMEDLNKAILLSQQKGENIGDTNIIKALSESIEPENLGRIAGDFSPGSMSAMNTILANGDRIFIPRNPNTINVLGEVLNPIAFEYSDRMTIRSAILNAGGYQDYADKGKVYVIKANGLIEKANRNIFVGNVDLEPGDSIIIPRKIITNRQGIDVLLPITQILSDLAFSAAALEALGNN